MNNLSKNSTLILLGLLFVLGSCGKSAYTTFSKPGEAYRSAQEIAELKRAERQQRKMAKESGLLTPSEYERFATASKRKIKDFRKQQQSRYASKEIARVISAARSYTGTPYKFGGTTRVGMDCSGLLCTSFQSINVKLPRTSTEQSHFGRSVSPRELRAGDLVFFSSSRSVNHITHVGMVTEVKGKDNVWFIHASTSLGVMEANLFTPYYQKIFVKAVRPNI